MSVRPKHFGDARNHPAPPDAAFHHAPGQAMAAPRDAEVVNVGLTPDHCVRPVLAVQGGEARRGQGPAKFLLKCGEHLRSYRARPPSGWGSPGRPGLARPHAPVFHALAIAIGRPQSRP